MDLPVRNRKPYAPEDSRGTQHHPSSPTVHRVDGHREKRGVGKDGVGSGGPQVCTPVGRVLSSRPVGRCGGVSTGERPGTRPGTHGRRTRSLRRRLLAQTRPRLPCGRDKVFLGGHGPLNLGLCLRCKAKPCKGTGTSPTLTPGDFVPRVLSLGRVGPSSLASDWQVEVSKSIVSIV